MPTPSGDVAIASKMSTTRWADLTVVFIYVNGNHKCNSNTGECQWCNRLKDLVTDNQGSSPPRTHSCLPNRDPKRFQEVSGGARGTFKRVSGADLRDAETVLAQLDSWIEDYNTRAPHSALRMRSPAEYRAKLSRCAVKWGAQDVPVAPVNEARRKGGLKGGKTRAKTLTARKRREIARRAARARWSKP